ncbi:MAG TPA: VanW family protein [Chloroflexia bacterium]|nr:VanW family protein [Chloroflexia bacterium]
MSQPPDNINRRQRLDGTDPDYRAPDAQDTQRSGYIPRVPRPAAAGPAANLPRVEPPPPRPPLEPPPWEDRPTAPLPVARPGAPAPAPGYRPRAAAPPADLAPVYDPSRAHVAPARAPRRGRAGAILGVLAGFTILLLIGLFALAGWYDQQYAGHMFPGVRVLGVDIGGKTPEEARLMLDNRVASLTSQPITLAWNDQQWTPQPQQLGLKVNLDSTIDNAYAVGRNGGLVSTWRDRWDVANEGRVVPLAVSLDEGAMQTYLEQQVAPKIDQPLQEGDVWLQGAQVKTSPAQEGHQLDVYQALITIRDSLARMASNSRIVLPVAVTKPQVSPAELDQTAKTLQLMLSGPLVARYGSKQYTVDPQKISQKLILLGRNADPGAAQHYTIGFQDGNLKALVADWADEIDTAPQNARFAWNNGQLSVLKESQDGVKVDQDKTLAALKAAISTPDKRAVDLPVTASSPKVSSKDIGALGIKELIGTGNTSFVGSTEARAKNIEVAAGYLNGVVVPPGETFSFLDAVAPITLDRGYVEGYVIAAERTQKGVGGGVCQVSTTTFRAAFWSALQITERHQHAYRVSWYESKGEPVGFDAAVFDPGVDFRFVNTTPGFLLIQAVMANQELNVNFYGTKIADEVKLVGPQIENQKDPPPDIYQLDPTLPPGTKKQVEYAHKGLDTTITRQIIKGGQVVSQDTFFSRFEAWPNWFMVAPDVQTPSPPRPAATPAPLP